MKKPEINKSSQSHENTDFKRQTNVSKIGKEKEKKDVFKICPKLPVLKSVLNKICFSRI